MVTPRIRLLWCGGDNHIPAAKHPWLLTCDFQQQCWGHLETEDGTAKASFGAVAANGSGGEAEDGLILREARAAPSNRGSLWRDVGDEPQEEFDGVVDCPTHGRPRQPAQQQR
ncbi:hypothetical protein E2562_011747 [Oryza meyeriana var. granulata]|uniref:Uncharacterized protein n=1 Tax=Oryza meyeriana var. granulata TaxID=110450 RepID=A0A6G1DHS1_9ORYZ|nr:hypothetical protein E2562_011747 [Oryza meyeriana var. granulata]